MVMDETVDRFGAYVGRRQQTLVRTAYLLTRDFHTAEDLVQTALVKAYLSWHRIRDSDSVDVYVRRIIINEHNSWWRRAWRRHEHSTSTVPDQSGVSDPCFTDRHVLWEQVQDLSAGQRAVVVLRFYEDLSEAETARVLGCSVGTVKSQTSRALAKLRSRIGESESKPTLAHRPRPAAGRARPSN